MAFDGLTVVVYETGSFLLLRTSLLNLLAFVRLYGLLFLVSFFFTVTALRVGDCWKDYTTSNEV